MGRLKGLKNVLPLNVERRWKLGPVQLKHAVFAGLEISAVVFGWWYYAWGSGYRTVFLALTVFLFMVFAKINSDLVAWLSKPRKKKEPKKKALQKKPESRFKHHM